MTINQYINKNQNALIGLENGKSKENLAKIYEIHKKVEKSPIYGAGIRLLSYIINTKKLNTDLIDINDKIVIIDALNSTNLQTQKSAVENIANIIKKCANFDALLKNGDKKAVEIIALANKNERINFSFATKYCAYHSYYLYDDKFSIYDNIVSEILPHYATPFKIKITSAKLDEMRKKCDYRAFDEIIKEVLDGYGLRKEQQIRRKFDHFLWWQGKKINEILKEKK